MIKLELAKREESSALAEQGTHPQQVESKTHDDDAYSKIKKLAQLRDEGILTEEEFAEKKKTILEKI